MTALLRPGDLAVLALGAGAVAALTWHAVSGAAGEAAVIRAHGAVVETLPLNRDRVLNVAGKLGPARVEVHAGRVRVASDPSPRQLCVRQGWLSRAGEAALCLPNQVSIEIQGAGRRHDTLAY